VIELITTNDPAVTRRLVELETEAFGSGGLNEWHIVPIIRHGRVYALRKNHELIGCIQYILDWKNRNKAYVIGISIAKEWRGRNLGTELFSESLNTLSREEITEVELTVSPENLAAIRIYKDKLAFRCVGKLSDEYGEGEDRLVMLKTLGTLSQA